MVKDIPDCDILIGGYPCQGFSVANMYRDEGDSKNKLYKELVRKLCLKKPKYFLFENVKRILSLVKGKIFKIITEELEQRS